MVDTAFTPVPVSHVIAYSPCLLTLSKPSKLNILPWNCAPRSKNKIKLSSGLVPGYSKREKVHRRPPAAAFILNGCLILLRPKHALFTCPQRFLHLLHPLLPLFPLHLPSTAAADMAAQLAAASTMALLVDLSLAGKDTSQAAEKNS
mmetsp:Transcript_4240/g.11463  ORF Transcript_4240/g.11463 Transcript_4240/m.11463 type:complete len:147 (-) Transcript_4240:1263-1703(-)